ncbi:MAG TPA: hypothetical protein PLJ35_20210 [Anaerolineae bacterium]|mgnify:CR=1 FL=1|nr:hypothetical protein [Anaerolineae bacterium]HOR01146.1 hypothetical protein [Anaerolineae bacterium]HPL27271.1 hypothetical protein [Anaerolineae bacterium]
MPAWPGLSAEAVGIWVAALLTLVMLSAAFGENCISRLGMALLAGAGVGYAGAMAWQAVLWPRILLVSRDPAQHWPLLIWFALGLLLLARGLSSASWLSNVSLAYLLGVGAALAIGGALVGTLLPQLVAAATPQGATAEGGWLVAANALLIAVGTGGVLFRFAYTGWSGEGAVGKLWVRLSGAWGQVGYGFVVVAMGAFFATAGITSLALLAARLEFLAVDWLHLVTR